MQAVSTNPASVQKWECAQGQFTGWSGGTRDPKRRGKCALQGLVTFENEVSARVFQTTTACANVTHRNAVRSCAMIWATFPGMHAGAERSSWWRWRPASRRLTSREGDSRKPCW